MARQIACPSCGEDEDLNGTRTAEGILITCRSCQATWLRDSIPEKCATCGGTDIEFHPQALTQYARGTQVSIVGWRHGPFCVSCDAEVVHPARDGKPIPAAYISAAAKPRGDNSTAKTLRVLPETLIGEQQARHPAPWPGVCPSSRSSSASSLSGGPASDGSPSIQSSTSRLLW